MLLDTSQGQPGRKGKVSQNVQLIRHRLQRSYRKNRVYLVVQASLEINFRGVARKHDKYDR